MKAKTLLLPLLLSVLISCGPSRTKEVDRIHTLESRLFSPKATSMDKEAADSLLALYSVFIKNFPADSMTQKYIFKAGTMYMNSGNGKAAIEMFDLYRSGYPNDPRSAMCLFFTAYVYENLLKNLDKAQELYILFIEKYPRNDFADDAQMALNNLGKTPDQMVKEFEQRRKADSEKIADSLKKAGKKKK
ncbi:MAG: tetratricopeptide repeat protein [Bacteroidetes bacterium]|nr:tetratricopeptide repeat protein [Bacteroidota bacterium]